MTLLRGFVVRFDPLTYRAAVRLSGAAAAVLEDVRVSAAIAPGDLIPGRRVLFEESQTGEPGDALVIATDHGAAGHGSGPWQSANGLVTVANTTAKSDLCRFTIPGGSLWTDRAVRLTAFGRLTNNTGAGQTVRLRLEFGTATLWDDVTASLAADAAYRQWRVEAVLSNREAADVQEMAGHAGITLPAGTTAGRGDIASAAAIDHTIGGTAAEDSSADRDLALTVALSAASASLTIDRRVALLELL
jgi:hypothetical protein